MSTSSKRLSPQKVETLTNAQRDFLKALPLLAQGVVFGGTAAMARRMLAGGLIRTVLLPSASGGNLPVVHYVRTRKGNRALRNADLTIVRALVKPALERMARQSQARELARLARRRKDRQVIDEYDSRFITAEERRICAATMDDAADERDSPSP